MNNIALVNDQPDQLATISDQFEITLDNDPDWRLIPIKPLPSILDYPSWVLENGITTLILDEKLFLGPLDDDSFVDYSGHEVANFIKESNKEIPIISLTNYSEEEDLIDSREDFHLILSRDEFDKDFDNYFNLIKKLSERYFIKNSERLSRMSEICELIAKGNSSEELIEELKSLRNMLNLPHYSSGLEYKGQVLELIDNQINEISLLTDEIEKFLESNGGSNDVVQDS